MTNNQREVGGNTRLETDEFILMDSKMMCHCEYSLFSLPKNEQTYDKVHISCRPKLEVAEGYQRNVFFKPLKIYAVRYLADILVITSGTYMMALDLKSRLVQILERNMKLGIDKVKTIIHSGTSEKIEFLEIELQAIESEVNQIFYFWAKR
ncbi:hypothetical protein RDI58_014877 [Solanum bulbocastanum]|uniref:Uncharacterized protein n=1 Tax=Solanum bulbocastanum TaxID=147425 RepID=A0AAN8TJT2_SOLBU